MKVYGSSFMLWVVVLLYIGCFVGLYISSFIIGGQEIEFSVWRLSLSVQYIKIPVFVAFFCGVGIVILKKMGFARAVSLGSFFQPLSFVRLHSLLWLVSLPLFLFMTPQALRHNDTFGDESRYFINIHSLTFDYDVNILNNIQRGDQLVFRGHKSWPMPEKLPDFRAHKKWYFQLDKLFFYSIHSLFYRLGFRYGVIFFINLQLMALGSLVLHGVYRLTHDGFSAFSAGLLTVFVPPLFCMSMTAFTEITGTLFLVVIFYLFYFTSPEKLCRGLSCSMMGCLFALVPWIHIRYSVIAGVFFLFYAYMLLKQSQSPFKRFLQLSFLPFISYPLVWYIGSQTYKGGDSIFNHAYCDFPFFLRHACALLFDRTYGLLVNCPVSLLFPIAFIWTYKKNKRLGYIVGVCCIIQYFSIAVYWGWTGGASPPPRYLVPVLPLFMICVGYYINEYKKGRLAFWWFLSLLSFFLSFMCMRGYRFMNVYCLGTSTRLFDFIGELGEVWDKDFSRLQYDLNFLMPSFRHAVPFPYLHCLFIFIFLVLFYSAHYIYSHCVKKVD